MKSNHQPYMACIFDFDYTLGDATGGIVMCVNYALEKMNLQQCKRDDIRKTIGLTLRETFAQLTKIDDDIFGNVFARYFKEKADLDMLANTELFPDTIQTLSGLKRKGLKIGIVTTKYHYRITQVLDKFQIPHLVDFIVGGEDVKIAKPDPEGLLFAIMELRVPRERTVFIGDSIVDAKTAANANVDFIAVTTGTTGKEAFSAYPCKQVIHTLSELTNHI